ncbi:MAG: hypothetical protein WDM81_06900 [Rhizomicrobium sp.]
MSFDLELAGRRALVTGGTKGVGAAVADALRDAGARIVATARAVPSQGARRRPVRGRRPDDRGRLRAGGGVSRFARLGGNRHPRERAGRLQCPCRGLRRARRHRMDEGARPEPDAGGPASTARFFLR